VPLESAARLSADTAGRLDEAAYVEAVDKADDVDQEARDTIVLDRSLWHLEEGYRRITEEGLWSTR
jgi:hypothetical protein